MEREYRCWAVYFQRSDYIDTWTIRRTRAEAISAFMGDYPTKPWAWWRRTRGLKVIRVTVQPERPAQ